jgi:7-carboxy-7-deazaguanine synthase
VASIPGGFKDLLITEIFHSLQGETSLSGIPFAFIRLTGCNLRCRYCDSAYAFKGGRKMSVAAVLDEVRPYRVRHALLTGGEPLLQRQAPELVDALLREGYQVSIETHGEVSIAAVADRARIIMDIKTPGSGMNRGGWEKNLPFLKPSDEVKFVICSESDYAWAREVVSSGKFSRVGEILFSPVVPAAGSPGTVPGVNPRWMAERILEDRLPVRLQVQLHKILWGADRKGV